MAAAQNGQRSRRRAQHQHALGAGCCASKRLGAMIGIALGFGTDDQRGQAAVRRPVSGPARF